jgi:hypothetical protein
MKSSAGIKSSLGTGKTFPANVSDLVIGFDKRIIMIDLPVALRAANHRLFVEFRIYSFNHCIKY